MRKAGIEPREKATIADFTLEDVHPEKVRFFANPEHRESLQVLHELETAKKNVEYQEREVELAKSRLQSREEDLESLQNALNALEEKVREQEPINLNEVIREHAESIAAIPWVEHVQFKRNGIYVRTRKNSLATTFDTRRVEHPTRGNFHEFQKPRTVFLPQYEILFAYDVENGGITNDENRLIIRIADHDYEDEDEEVYAHWASTRNTYDDYGDNAGWDYVCLGDYGSPLVAAAQKGFVTFLNEFAVFLQLSGDQHAYRPKIDWALMFGDTYRDACYREAALDEDMEVLKSTFRDEYRRRHNTSPQSNPNLEEFEDDDEDEEEPERCPNCDEELNGFEECEVCEEEEEEDEQSEDRPY